MCLWSLRTIGSGFALGIFMSKNLPIDDNTSRAAGIVVVDDQEDRLVEHTAKTLVGNQNTAGLNVRNLRPMQGTERDAK